MRKFTDVVQARNGTALPGATVTVRVANVSPGTGALATIYSDDGVTVVAGSAVTTDTNGRYSFYAADGRYDLTITGTGITPLTLPDTGEGGEVLSAKIINAARFADQFANIQAAITDAGTTGSVVIPANYVGTDTYNNPNGIAVIDLRGSGNSVRLWSGLETSFPTVGFPEGNDLFIRTRGPADLYIEKLKAAAVGTTALSIGANASVVVGAVTVGNTIRGTLQTGTTALLSTSAPLYVGRETANEELVAMGNWSIVDGTHLSITCAKSHTQPVDIEQLGTVAISAADITLNGAVLKPSLNTTYSAPIRVKDSFGNLFLYLPSNTGDIWPYSAVQFVATLTGANGGNKNLVVRNSSSASAVQINNSASGANIFNFSENVNGALMTMSNPTNTPFRVDASATDLTRITAGGTVAGFIFYGNLGAGNSGIFRFRNNAVDDVQKVSIDTAQGNIITTGNVNALSATLGSGTPITKSVVYTPSLSPAAVAGTTSATQTFTVTGLTTSDIVTVNPVAALPAGLVISACWVSAADTLSISFGNLTAGSLTPTASSAYRILAVRS